MSSPVLEETGEARATGHGLEYVEDEGDEAQLSQMDPHWLTVCSTMD